MNEVEKHIREIDDAVAEYRNKYASKPKILVLDMEHRQAIKLMYPKSHGGRLDPIAWGGIEIIKKEDSIIL